jgi:hypothetical protein
MKMPPITAALLTTALITGCSDRSSQNGNNPPPDGAAGFQTQGSADAPPQARPGPVSPDAGTVGRSANARGSSATTGTRATPPPASGSNDRFDPSPRDDRAASRPEPAAPARRVPEFRQITVPAGTSLPLELLTALSSSTAAVESPVRARVRQPVTVDNYTAIPAGAVLSGTVTDVATAGRVQVRSHVTFRFDSVQLNGGREELTSNPITFQGEASKGEDATRIGVGAGIGAAIGGIVGGAKGAAKGAAIGGAGGTGVVLATRGKEVEVASGADVTATLATPFNVRVPVN